jgi:hypothetical protein
MSFLDTIRRVFSGRIDDHDDDIRQKLAEAWGLDVEEVGDEPTEGAASAARAPEPTAYDRRLWVKKLAFLINEKLPIDDDTWSGFLAEAYALGYDRDWVQKQLHDTFDQLVRRAVKDGIVTPSEHEKIEQARIQLGLSEAEAEASLARIMTEAEKIFGRPIRGK